MKRWAFKRAISIIPVTLGISFIVFLMMQFTPGDFISQIKTNPDVPKEYFQELENTFGLNQAWYLRYWNWLKGVFTLDFGNSWAYQMPALELILYRLPATISLTFTALVLSWAIGIPMALFAAYFKDSFVDKILKGTAYIFLSIPEFFLALLAIFIVSKTNLWPIAGKTSIDHDFLTKGSKVLDFLQHLILPATVLSLSKIAYIFRITRSHCLDFAQKEYITTAKAKGLNNRSIWVKHILKNSLSPLTTNLGFSLSGLFSGTLLIEIIFNYHGVGKLLYDAFFYRDQFVVMAAVFLCCIFIMAGHVIADLLLAFVDPRARSLMSK